MKPVKVLTLIAAFVYFAFASSAPVIAQTSMGGMASVDAPTVPAVTGYSQGQEILFIHTEVSDSEIAKILSV